MGKPGPSGEAIIEGIRGAAARLGRAPSSAEFREATGFRVQRVYARFNSWGEAVRRAGFMPAPKSTRIADELLLADWGTVARRLGEAPTAARYRREGKYSASLFRLRFKAWASVSEIFRRFAEDKPEWSDVAAALPAAVEGKGQGARIEKSVEEIEGLGRVYPRLEGRPILGNPTQFGGLLHEPLNELGVVMLFGMVAEVLGYKAISVRGAYPDCEAIRRIGRDAWQRVRVEFEFESRNFEKHGHPVDGCDVIVCWRHNWKKCPKAIEVVELEAVVRGLAVRGVMKGAA